MGNSRKRAYKNKLFMIYLIVTLVPTLIFIVFIHTHYINRLEEYTLGTLSKSMDSLIYSVDSSFGQLDDIVTNILLEDDIKKQYQPEKPTEVNELKKQLNHFIVTSSIVDEIAICEENNEYLFSNRSSYTKERYLKLKGLDDMTLETFNSLICELIKPTVIKASGVDQAIHVFYPVNIGQVKKVIIFSIDADNFNPYFREAMLSQRGYGQIMANNGEVLVSYSSGGELLSETIEKCLSGEKIVYQGREVLYAVQSSSGSSGLSYVLIVQSEEIRSEVMHLLSQWTLLVMLVVLLGFIDAFMLMQIGRKPIVRLKNQVVLAEEEPLEWKNEEEQISAHIKKMNDFADRINSQMIEMNDYLTARLLCGELESADEAHQLSRLLGATIYAHSYQVCMIHFFHKCTAQKAREVIRKMLPEGISFLLRPIDDDFACVFFYSIEEKERNDVFCDAFLSQFCDGKLSFGNIYEDMDRIPISFMEAYIVADRQTESIDDYKCEERISESVDRFASAVGNCDTDAAMESVRDLVDMIENGGYPVLEAACVYLRVCAVLKSSEYAKALPQELPGVFTLIEMVSLDLIKGYFQMLLEVLEEQRSSGEKEPTAIEQMVQYLQDNYLNPNFTLEQMAFDFHMAPSALSRYYKNNTDQNINDYLNGLKMKKAQELLLESDLAVYEIGIKLGYTGQNSFIRRFKATYGMTPGKYREENTVAGMEI